jgi:hypothetical protein
MSRVRPHAEEPTLGPEWAEPWERWNDLPLAMQAAVHWAFYWGRPEDPADVARLAAMEPIKGWREAVFHEEPRWMVRLLRRAFPTLEREQIHRVVGMVFDLSPTTVWKRCRFDDGSEWAPARAAAQRAREQPDGGAAFYVEYAAKPVNALHTIPPIEPFCFPGSGGRPVEVKKDAALRTRYVGENGKPMARVTSVFPGPGPISEGFEWCYWRIWDDGERRCPGDPWMPDIKVWPTQNPKQAWKDLFRLAGRGMKRMYYRFKTVTPERPYAFFPPLPEEDEWLFKAMSSPDEEGPDPIGE